MTQAPGNRGRSLDFAGRGYLKAKMECLGVNVLLARNTAANLFSGKTEEVAFKDGMTLEADFVVIKPGIRPKEGLGG